MGWDGVGWRGLLPHPILEDACLEQASPYSANTAEAPAPAATGQTPGQSIKGARATALRLLSLSLSLFPSSRLPSSLTSALWAYEEGGMSMGWGSAVQRETAVLCREGHVSERTEGHTAGLLRVVARAAKRAKLGLRGKNRPG